MRVSAFQALAVAVASLGAIVADAQAPADGSAPTAVAPPADGSAPSPVAPPADGGPPPPAAKPTAAPWFEGDDPNNPDDGPIGINRFGHVVDVWPYPAEATAGNGILSVDSSFALTVDASSVKLDDEEQGILDRAFERTKANVFKPYTRPYFRSDIFEDKVGETYPGYTPEGAAVPASGCSVSIKTAGDPLQQGMKEDYSLDIGSDGKCSLEADSIWGALRGLETLSQLIDFIYYEDKLGFYIQRTPIHIKDTPAFGWRGLHIDTARHFEPKEYIFHILDGMAYLKLNTMHWHFTDSETFPFVSKKFPELQTRASYQPDAVYTYNDIEEIVEYGRDRGIRIMAEIDTPGHSAAIGQAYPEISANCWDWLRGQFPQGLVWPAFNRIPLDVSRNRTMEILEGLFEEFASLFPFDYIHIGGDEVRVACWKELPHFLEWMKSQHELEPEFGMIDENGEPQYLAAEGWWMTKLQERVENNPLIKKTAVVWEESLRNNFTLLENTLVHVWEDPAVMKRAVDEKKYHVNSWGWYLDRMAPTCGFMEPTCPTQWMWIRSWLDMYKVDPYLGGEVTEYNVGGMAASWAESIDPTNFDARVFSRLPAVAERLWRPYPSTPQRLNDEAAEAQHRYSSYRCKMAQRGIRATATASEWCDLSVFYPELYGNADMPGASPLYFATARTTPSREVVDLGTTSTNASPASSSSGSSGTSVGWVIGAALIGVVLGVIVGAVFMRFRGKKASSFEAQDASSVAFENK